jgi:hypothetical protein
MQKTTTPWSSGAAEEERNAGNAENAGSAGSAGSGEAAI